MLGASNAADESRARRYAKDYLERHREVEGWLSDIAARSTAHLLEMQSELGVAGNVLEFGVHHGRYFIALLGGLQPGEIGVAVQTYSMPRIKVHCSMGWAHGQHLCKTSDSSRHSQSST